MTDKTGKTEAVQRMQDYIEAHLAERITLCDLSRATLQPLPLALRPA